MPSDRHGFAPIEIFTKVKLSNYSILQGERVFGCPVYVLNPKLQDGKKIPKWDPRSRQGQYLGFSPNHAGSVGLILNLRTKYVSPQYHVVYDEKFTTVPSYAKDGSVVNVQAFDANSWNRLIATGWERSVDLEDAVDEHGNSNTQPFPQFYREFIGPELEQEENQSLEQERTSAPGGDGVRNSEVSTDGTQDVSEVDPTPTVRVPPIQVRIPTPKSKSAPGLKITPIRVKIPTPNSKKPVDVSEQVEASTPTPVKRETEGATATEGDIPDDWSSDSSYAQSSDDDSVPQVQSSPRSRPRRNRKRPARHTYDHGWKPTDPASAHPMIMTAMKRHNAPTRRPSFDNPKKKWRRPKAIAKVSEAQLNKALLQGMDWNDAVGQIHNSEFRAMVAQMEDNTDLDLGTVEEFNPLAFAAKANAEDTPNYHEAMNGPHHEEYWKAMVTEVTTLIRKGVWTEVDRTSDMHVLPGTWAYRRKVFPNGEIRKFKARFCVRGDQQIEGVDYFDTFAPVVNWTTVRLLLILSTVLQLETRQVDYTAAFVHADIDKPPNFDKMTPEEQEKSGVYIECPRGFGRPGKVLKLNKSLYGLKQSPRNFFLHLKSKLERIGFKSNPNVDPCLFVSNKVICLVYVDDTLLFSPKAEWIDEAIQNLRNQEMELEEEDEVAGFLGVDIRRDPKAGTVKLTQEGLAKRIIEALQISDSKAFPPKRTPASGPLVMDKDGDPPNGIYNYATVVGMLAYLTGHSRPELAFATSQVARFVHCPRRSHEEALERIGQYLRNTTTEGLVLRPTDILNIDCYVDADFCGLWPNETKLDPSCVKSRTGYAICVADCPIVWTSKLQPDIALSTMMAEYTALSMAMKEVLPIRNLLLELSKSMCLDQKHLTTFKTTVHEDNMGALTLAKMEEGQVTPRSKFYAVKLHWFRSHLKPNDIVCEKIDTKIQRADLMTKALPVATFEKLRELLCGW